MRTRAAGTLVGALLAFSAPAQAANMSFERLDDGGSAIVVTAVPGEENSLGAYYGEDSSRQFTSVELSEGFGVTLTLTSGAAGGCEQRTEQSVVCTERPGAIVVDLGDRADRFDGENYSAVTPNSGFPIPVIGTGGTGDDYFDTGSGIDVLFGGDGADTFESEQGDDELHGEEGADSFRAHAGDDRIDGGPGDDDLQTFLAGSSDEDEAGADTFIGGGGRDKLSYLFGGRAVSVTFDGVANDGGASERDSVADDIEEVVGSSLTDVLIGNGGAQELTGAEGHDDIRGGGGADVLRGSAGADTVLGGDGADRVEGGDDADIVDGGNGADEMIGGSGPDRIQARDGAADPVILCGDGTDHAIVDEADGVRPNGIERCETVDVPPASGGGTGTGSDAGGTDSGSSGGTTAPAGTGGEGIGSPTVPVATAPPLVRSLVSARGRFTPRTGFRFIISLAAPARVEVRVSRVGAARRSARTRALGTVRFRARAGRNTLSIKKIGRKRLQRGRYTARVTVVANGQRSAPRTLRFRIR